MPAPDPTAAKPRGRPPSAAARNAILNAAAALLADGGMGAVTIEAVARHARVGKPTIYRHWPGREALAMAAVLHGGAPSTAVMPTGAALADLELQVTRVAETFSAPRGRHAVLMVAASDPGSEIAKAFRTQVMLASRAEGRALLARAIEDREVRGDIAAECVLDAIYGAIFYRLLIGHQPVDGAFIATLMRTVRQGIAPLD